MQVSLHQIPVCSVGERQKAAIQGYKTPVPMWGIMPMCSRCCRDAANAAEKMIAPTRARCEEIPTPRISPERCSPSMIKRMASRPVTQLNGGAH